MRCARRRRADRCAHVYTYISYNFYFIECMYIERERTSVLLEEIRRVERARARAIFSNSRVFIYLIYIYRCTCILEGYPYPPTRCARQPSNCNLEYNMLNVEFLVFQRNFIFYVEGLWRGLFLVIKTLCLTLLPYFVEKRGGTESSHSGSQLYNIGIYIYIKYSSNIHGKTNCKSIQMS